VHRRTISMEVFEHDEHFVVVGLLEDQRPFASGKSGPRHLHQMELALVVRRSDLTIVDAEASMVRFPHAECQDIEPAFSDLVGMSVARGYTAAVQARFGRQRGCSHVEFLARALGPVVVQAVTSAAARRAEDGEATELFGDATATPAGPMAFLANTCHVWSEGGIGQQKLHTGWRPGQGEYPAPPLVEIRRRQRADG